MASENQEKKFLYDIIYCDRTRISPLISQLNAHGLPKDVAVTENAGSKSGSQSGGTVGWSFMAKGELKGHFNAENNESLVQATTYDPYWATVLAFADQAISLAKRDAFEIGKLCLITGGLSVADVSSLSDLMKLNITQENMIVGLMPEEESNKSKAKKAARSSYENIQGVIDLYSDSVQAVLDTNNGEYWMSIDRDHLIFSAKEIILKFGSIIPGKWSILGVYDSSPSVTPEAEFSDDGAIQGMVMGIAPIVRQLVGKKDSQHSITPLMIMREV